MSDLQDGRIMARLPVQLVERLLLSIWAVFFTAVAALAQERTAHLGVLAFRGEEQAVLQWTPLADYLSDRIEGWRFDLVPVTLVSAPEKIRAKEVDFLITNPGHYVTLAPQFELSVLATRERRAGATGVMQFGTVIFTRADSAIHALDDLRGKRLAAVSPDAFGGFQLAWQEFRQQGIDIFEDLETVRFLGFPQDGIVAAVAAGEVEAGVIRSGLLENLASEHRFKLEDFRVLQNNTQPDYPYMVSGRLYPEWPFTAVPGVDKRLREKVVLALLSNQNGADVPLPATGDLWSAPLSYESVRSLIADYREHQAGNGRGLSENIGFITALTLGSVAIIVATLTGLALRRRRTLAPLPVADAEPDRPTAQEIAPFERLTPREREVLAMICVGKSSKTIARDLGISPKTVEYHRANLLQKTEARSTAHLVQMVTRLEPHLGFSLGDSNNIHV